MKDFFRNKTNIILTAVLAVLVVAAAFLLWQMFGPEPIKAIDFSKLNEDEVKEWQTQYGVSDDLLTIRYEYDEEVEKGYVVYQSIKEGEDISDGITIVISNGYDPNLELELPDIEGLTKTDLKSWFDTNHFSEYRFEYVLSEDKPLDMVIALNKSGKAKRSEEIIATVSAGNDAENIIITVPDFKDYTKEEIDEWAQNNMVNVHYTYVLSPNYPSGAVIEQNIESQTEITVGTVINITISQGNGVAVEDFYGTSRSYVDNWCKANGIKVAYYYTASSLGENLVVSTDPKAGTLIGNGSTLTVYLSEGQKEKETVNVGDDLLNMSESAFVEHIKSLGLNASKSNTTYFSTTIASGNIYSYEDGDFPIGDTITYSLSIGKYSFNADEFNNKSKSSANTLVQNLNARNAHVSIKFNNVETSDYSENTVYGCTASASGINTNITCNVAITSASSGSDGNDKPSVETVNVPNYVGQASPCGNDSSCTIDSINYSVSYDYSDTYDSGIVISQSASGVVNQGTKISLVVSQGIETAYIGDKDLYNGGDYESSLASINRNLSVFNLTIENHNIQNDEDYSDGQIISIIVGNLGEAYTPGEYPVSTSVLVTIAKK